MSEHRHEWLPMSEYDRASLLSPGERTMRCCPWSVCTCGAVMHGNPEEAE